MKNQKSVTFEFKFSVVIPCNNEQENLEFFLPSLVDSLKEEIYEIIIINDGSTDDTKSFIQDNYPDIRMITHKKCLGLSAGLMHGAQEANNEWVITIDGDGEIPAHYVKEAIDYFKKQYRGEDIAVFAERATRKDGWVKVFQSNFGRKFMNFFLKSDWKNTISPLKVISKKTFVSLPFFEGVHRFIPYLIKAKGVKCWTFPIHTVHRRFGQTHFNLGNRGLNTALDLVLVALLTHKIKKWVKRDRLKEIDI